MSQPTLVTTNLLRIYRPIGLWFWSTMISGITIAAFAVVLTVTDVGFSLWAMIAGTAARYWIAVVGVTLVGTHLRQFVATGVTRRAFVAGAGLFGLLVAVLFTVAVVAGHGLEQWLVGLTGPLAADYPVVSPVSDVVHILPADLAFLVSGAAVTAGFYRFGPLKGLLLLVPGLLPVAVSEGLVGRGEYGEAASGLLPSGLGVAVSLLVTALVAVICQRLVGDVTIRRATG